MKPLTKRELVTRISNELGMNQVDVFQVIQKTLDLITDALAQGRGVELRNFGVFDVRLSKPRVGRNPIEPDIAVAIPSRATVRFKAGKTMKQRVLLYTDTLKASQDNPPAKSTRRKKANPATAETLA